ncbi:universal stress protein YxiE-like [Mangifera indica]|uniref:universal stress protein YxiE-like n=1 Tax=Mangifera indica TaxID=29780 RepID=UPI001CFB9344|nr:universal stress protein YxiE-like [Mangifera indica]
MAEVLSVGGGSGKKVMLAIDESDYSYYALMWVLENLKDSINKGQFIIFMAQQPTNYNYTFAASLGTARMYCPTAANSDFVNSAQENHRKLALAYLEKAREICASKGVTAELVTEVGDPKAAICTAVQKLNINMLILGERGLGKVKRALIGSVSNYCIQYAKCPVLVVKKPQATTPN